MAGSHRPSFNGSTLSRQGCHHSMSDCVWCPNIPSSHGAIAHASQIQNMPGEAQLYKGPVDCLVQVSAIQV